MPPADSPHPDQDAGTPDSELAADPASDQTSDPAALLADLQRWVADGITARALAEGRDPATAANTSLAEELLAERAAEARREELLMSHAAEDCASGASEGPMALCRRYVAGGLTREALVQRLVFSPYAKVERDPFGDVSPAPPGAWSEVEAAARRGLIEEDIYDEVFTQRLANRTGKTAYRDLTGQPVEPNTQDAWFWSPAWQAGEAEVDAALARGESAVFETTNEFLAHLPELEHRTAEDTSNL